MHNLGQDGGTARQQTLFQRRGGLWSGGTDDFGLVLEDLFGEEIDVGAGGEGVDDEIVRTGVDNLQGLGANGTGAAQEREALLEL